MLCFLNMTKARSEQISLDDTPIYPAIPAPLGEHSFGGFGLWIRWI